MPAYPLSSGFQWRVWLHEVDALVVRRAAPMMPSMSSSGSSTTAGLPGCAASHVYTRAAGLRVSTTRAHPGIGIGAITVSASASTATRRRSAGPMSPAMVSAFAASSASARAMKAPARLGTRIMRKTAADHAGERERPRGQRRCRTRPDLGADRDRAPRPRRERRGPAASRPGRRPARHSATAPSERQPQGSRAREQVVGLGVANGARGLAVERFQDARGEERLRARPSSRRSRRRSARKPSGSSACACSRYRGAGAPAPPAPPPSAAIGQPAPPAPRRPAAPASGSTTSPISP